MKTQWKQNYSPLGGTNYVLNSGGFYISFNPDLSASVFGSMFGSDDGGCETALCKGDKFYILNGDYRSQYEKLVPLGFDACKKFYDQQSAHSDSSWSNIDERCALTN